jgi:hypothetical protein
MTAQLRDGVVKRGESWSYVVRVADPDTGCTKPRWVGGFPTESAARPLAMRLEWLGGGASTSIDLR